VWNSQPALKLGLTGGIGSGKSTIAAFFAERGATVIDADAISRAVTGAGGLAIKELRDAFGPRMLTANGALDRNQMRALIFSDPSAKIRLEKIVHPLVGGTIAEKARLANECGARCIVFDIPLLVESEHWRKMLDRILVVDCTERTQIDRVAARNGLPDDEIRKIIAAQAPRFLRLQAADTVVFNDGISVEDLAQHVKLISTEFEL
jgi:dephospho-CoA kinase